MTLLLYVSQFDGAARCPRCSDAALQAQNRGAMLTYRCNFRPRRR